MTHTTPARWPRRPSISLMAGLAVATLSLAHTSQAAPDSAPAPTKALHIKNAHIIRVVLGKKRESAAAVRPDPDKGGWRLVLSADLDGGSVDLEDVTPKIRGSKWTLTVTDGAVALDAGRFLATHVYRLVARRGRQLLGNALVYLVPPAAPPGKSHVDFAEDTEGQDPTAPMSPSPKGAL